MRYISGLSCLLLQVLESALQFCWIRCEFYGFASGYSDSSYASLL